MMNCGSELLPGTRCGAITSRHLELNPNPPETHVAKKEQLHYTTTTEDRRRCADVGSSHSRRGRLVIPTNCSGDQVLAGSSVLARATQRVKSRGCNLKSGV